METTTGAISLGIGGVLASPTYSSISTYPYNTVVLIETKNPANPGQFSIGSGVVIGPHTILTASHMLWSSMYQSEANQVWLYPAYNQSGFPNPPGSLGPLNARLAWHNYTNIGVPFQNLISQSDSQYDFAVIDTDYTFTSWMNVLLDYGGGSVHVTGYPGIANGLQTDNFGNVTKDPRYSLLDYPANFVFPGNSGGPLWLAGFNYVVGIVSTGSWAAQLTAADWNTILAWESADSYLWAGSPIVNPAITVTASGDFNSNGNSDFVWRNSSGLTSMWEYNASAQQVTTTSLGATPGWTVVGSGHFSSIGTSQMLMDYPAAGTMTLWWVNSNGQLVGSNLGPNWANVGYVASGAFNTALSGAGITSFLVADSANNLYDWWVSPNNTLTGYNLGAYWSGVQLVTVGSFDNHSANTEMLVQNPSNGHLYEWWIGANSLLTGYDLGGYWSGVQLVTAGQFDNHSSFNELLVTNPSDGHLYEWWIDTNGALTGYDLGGFWSGVQLVTVGHFDNNTAYSELLVANPSDGHLYEWWIGANNLLTGIDLGAHWVNVQLIGNSHYNNNSANNELLVRNTADNHFYEWWIAGNQLTGVDLGVVAGSSAEIAGAAGTGFGVSGGARASSPDLAAPATGAGAFAAGETSLAGPGTVSSGSAPILPAPSPDPAPLLVQAMASFGASDAATDPTGTLVGPVQQPEIAAADPRSAHGA